MILLRWVLSPRHHWRRPLLALAILAGLFAGPAACEALR